MSRVVSQLRRFSALVTSGCAVLALSVAAHAQTFSITNVTNNSASKASYPTMVVDANGNLNLVWVDSVNGIMFARSSSTTAGTTLGTVVTVPGSKGQALPAFQPQIAVDPNDARVIAITWAALDPSSPVGGPAMYDVYASWSNTSVPLFTTGTAPGSRRRGHEPARRAGRPAHCAQRALGPGRSYPRRDRAPTRHRDTHHRDTATRMEEACCDPPSPTRRTRAWCACTSPPAACRRANRSVKPAPRWNGTPRPPSPLQNWGTFAPPSRRSPPSSKRSRLEPGRSDYRHSLLPAGLAAMRQ